VTALLLNRLWRQSPPGSPDGSDDSDGAKPHA